MLEVSLDISTLSGSRPHRRVFLREIQGHDELLDMSEPGSVPELIERLLVRRGASAEVPRVEQLSLSELDQITSRIYTSLYGDEIECRVRCVGCAKDFHVSFSLAALWRFVREQSAEDAESLGPLDGPDELGVFRLGDTVQFRLPTYADLVLTEGLAPGEALTMVAQRCVLQGAPTQAAAVDRAMTLVGPRLDADLDVSCAVCQHSQQVNFDIEQFLKAALSRERALVTSEVHVLARAYGWARSEILAMSRRDRQLHVQLVLSEGERGHAQS